LSSRNRCPPHCANNGRDVEIARNNYRLAGTLALFGRDGRCYATNVRADMVRAIIRAARRTTEGAKRDEMTDAPLLELE
jgi:hypothetical protein